MTTQEFLIVVECDEWTRFVQDPEYLRRQLQAVAQRFFTLQTQGSIAAVTVTVGDPDLSYSEVRELLEDMLPLLLDGEQCNKALEDGRAFLEKLLARKT